MKISNFSHKELTTNPLGLIHDYQTLAPWLGAKPYVVSHVLHNMNVVDKRDALSQPYAQQLKLSIPKGKGKVRVVYQSRPALDFLQKRLLKEFNELTHAIPHDHLWAYMPGKNPRKLPLLLQDSKMVVHFDIVGYFDNITFTHISESLQAMGMSKQGANLATRLSVVERNTPRGKVRSLQQGSAASSPLSNLVGYMFFDQTLMEWLEKNATTEMATQYHRYCDNIYLGIKGNVPLDFIQRFKEFVHGTMRQRGFSTHKWCITSNTNPKRAQKVLGIVVNHAPRVENAYFEETRCLLFNACTHGLEFTAMKFFDQEPMAPKNTDDTFFNVGKSGSFLSKIGGRANYIGDVNPMHKAQLRKLLAAIQALELWRKGEGQMSFTGMGTAQALPDQVFTVLKEYRTFGESTESYLERLHKVLQLHTTATVSKFSCYTVHS